MVDVIYSNAFSEVLEILKYVSKEDYEKIPLEIIEVIEDNCSKDYKVEYNPNISLAEQKISEEARTIIAVFFRDYWATEKQREKILLKEKYDNDIEEKEKRKKFDPDKIFDNVKTEEKYSLDNKNKHIIVEETKNIKKDELVIYKENIFIKIFKKIKNFFNKK